MNFIILKQSSLNNYFNLHICLSICLFCLLVRVSDYACVQKLVPILAVLSKNITNKSCLRVKRKKYALWFILGSLGCMR